MIDQNKESTVNNVVLKLFLWIQHETIYYTYLKKSVLQYNLPSLEKHRSAKILRQSAQRTHSACHVRSNTVSKNLSKMARSQPAHVMIILTTPVPHLILCSKQYSNTGKMPTTDCVSKQNGSHNVSANCEANSYISR